MPYDDQQQFGTTKQPPVTTQRRNDPVVSQFPGTGGGGAGQERNRATQGGLDMGGGTPKAPKPTDPMVSAKAQDWLAQQQYARDQATATAASDKAKADKLAAQGYTTGEIQRLMGGGQNYLTQHLADLGYTDSYGIGNRFNDLLGQAKQNVPGEATDVGKYFDYGDLFNTATAGAQTAQQGKLDTALRAATPTGYQSRAIADTADDPILQEILAQQQGDLQSTLQRKLDRGQMSQGAFDYAQGQMGNLSTGAMSQLQGIGGGVLSKYRNQLSDLAGAFGSDVQNYKLGQNIDPSTWGTQLSEKATQLQGGLKGDITSALGNTQLFDPNALISKAGSYAGASNQPITGSTPQGTGNVPLEEQARGQGTSGVF